MTIAITAFLSTIFFTGMAQEKNRSALKQTADQLQVDLQGMQNNVQTGLVAPFTSCLGGANDRIICPNAIGDCPNGVCQLRPPAGFGLAAAETGTTYRLFADMPGGVAGAYDPTVNNPDATVRTKTLATNISLHQITYVCASCVVVNPTAIDITFSGIKGDATLCIQPGPACNLATAIKADSATIVLRQTALNLCYAVSIQKVGGIVTKRQLTTCV